MTAADYFVERMVTLDEGRSSFYITPEIDKMLKIAAAEDDLNFSQVDELALEEYLERGKKTKLSRISFWHCYVEIVAEGTAQEVNGAKERPHYIAYSLEHSVRVLGTE